MSANIDNREASDQSMKQESTQRQGVNHTLHFFITLMTFGLWGLVWWGLILKQQGKQNQWFSGFDDDYWSYLMEREQPPASLYPIKFNSDSPQANFDA